MKNLFLFFTVFSLIALSCTNPQPKSDSEEGMEAPEFKLTELWSTDTVMTTCESVLFDKSREQLFVSCINGTPTDKNGQGFIAVLKPDGTVDTREWVKGLNAPKGMGVFGDQLFVTDIDELVVIDIPGAKVIERIPVEGSTFLNDISVDKDGTVYFSDSDTGKLYKYSNGEVKTWISDGLDRPNGLFVEKDRVLLTSSGSQDLKSINKETGEAAVVATGIGYGDGVEFTGMDGYYITSSWAGEVFLIYPDSSKVSLLKTSDQEINSADIGFDKKEKIVYVPTFFDNRVVAYKLEEVKN